jgi:hypothetical protein
MQRIIEQGLHWRERAAEMSEICFFPSLDWWECLG